MFKEIKTAVQTRMQLLSRSDLYLVDLDRDILFQTYLNALPLEERQPHNCNCCKSFLRNYGNVVAFEDGKLRTLWEFSLDGIYKDVPKALHDLVANAEISSPFISKLGDLGTDFNHQDKEGRIITWEHFYTRLPQSKVFTGYDSIDSEIGKARTNKAVFKRALGEISVEATETILELIAQNSLYRGSEHKVKLQKFHTNQLNYLDTQNQDLFAWANYRACFSIRNSSIGTLLLDLSNGMELDQAVRKFEAMVAPANYKRPTALITKGMIEKAEKSIKALGLENSLGRRHANQDDIPLENVRFVDRGVKETGLFESMKDAVLIDTRKFSKVEEVPVDKFIREVLPIVESIEVLFENKHQNNLMSLVAPKDVDSSSLFPWGNGLSWDYKGGVADSMKERVKAKGGKVDGVLRFSLQWNEESTNNIDFDAHCIEPNRNRISFPNKGRVHQSSGRLDVDIINPRGSIAVENICWSDKSRMLEGEYQFIVHNYSSRRSEHGFSAELEYNGVITTFEYSSPLNGDQYIQAAKAVFNREDGFTITESLEG